MKKVAFNMPKKATTADDWVQSPRATETEQSAIVAPSPVEAMKRFTIDVPVELHRRIKSQCATRGAKMADVLREIMEREFPKS